MNEIVVAGQHHVLPRASQSASPIRKYLDMLSGGRATDAVRYMEREGGVSHVAAAFDAFSHVSQGAGAGGLFGFMAKHDMIEWDGAPLDAWAAGVAAVTGTLLARYAVGQVARNFAGNATAIFAFRSVSGWKASINTTGVSAHGDADMGADPIEEAARGL